MKKRVNIRYTGTVQGVGFRYVVRHTASRFGVTGWVRNVEDGSVEVVAEGDEEAIRAMLESIDDRFSGYIQDADVVWSDSTEGYSAFDVRF